MVLAGNPRSSSNTLFSNTKKKITFSLRKNQTAKQSWKVSTSSHSDVAGVPRKDGEFTLGLQSHQGREGRAVGEARGPSRFKMEVKTFSKVRKSCYYP